MKDKKNLGCRRVLVTGIWGLSALCILAVGLSTLSNTNLPKQSPVVDRLSNLQKARLTETIHLRESLGDTSWPGFGKADIPYAFYNEQYAFLVGYPQPPDGWTMMPRQERRGGAWEAVPDDTFEGQGYYRQLLANPEKTPENFTVLIGDRWAATMQTQEFSEISFYQGFAQDLPPVVDQVFPLRLAWKFIMGNTENYIGGLEHEAFHAFVGSVVPQRLADAENVMSFESQYPFDDPSLDQAWRQEMGVLVQAAQAKTEDEARQLARQFLALRDARRSAAKLSPDLVNLERQREWLEGLAKYNELNLGLLAGTTPGYQPAAEISQDPAFHKYGDRQKFWSEQLDEAKQTQGRSGETRFYYAGNAIAVLLDRLSPGWKEHALTGNLFLEDLLREAAGS